MEPVSLILTALAAGASAGALDSLKDDAKEKAKAAYAKVRNLAARRLSGRSHGELALAEYGAAPQKWEGLLAAELTEAGAGRDQDLVAAARAFLELADPSGARGAKYAVTVKDSKGVQIGDGNVQINNEIVSEVPGNGVTQHIHAGRDAYTSGGDMTIHQRPE